MAALKELSNRNNYKIKDVLEQLNQYGLNENVCEEELRKELRKITFAELNSILNEFFVVDNS